MQEMIEPDTKDWTWVLQRPCPECGFDAQATPASEVGARILDNADAWSRVLNRTDTGRRPNPTTWSALEYGCHVRDVHRTMQARVVSMLTEEEPLFPNWDQDETAIQERYAVQDPQQVRSELTAAAEAVAAVYRMVAGDQWSRVGRRDNGSEFTVETIALYHLHDVVHHIWDVTPSQRAAGADV